MYTNGVSFTWSDRHDKLNPTYLIYLLYLKCSTTPNKLLGNFRSSVLRLDSKYNLSPSDTPGSIKVIRGTYEDTGINTFKLVVGYYQKIDTCLVVNALNILTWCK